MKTDHSLSIDPPASATAFRGRDRFSACSALFLLFISAFTAPNSRAGCEFFWGAQGGGDVGDPNNWSTNECSPDAPIPGPNDTVQIDGRLDNNGDPLPIAVTGNLNVAGASIGVAVTMTGTVTASRFVKGYGATFMKDVTGGFVEVGGNTIFKGAVTSSGGADSGGVAFTANGTSQFTLVNSATFGAGTSLTTTAGALGIGAGITLNGASFGNAGLTLSDGATATINAGSVPVNIGLSGADLPASTAVFMFRNTALNLSGAGTQFTANGDLIVGIGFVNLAEPAAVNIIGGAKLITNGKSSFGTFLPGDPNPPSNGTGTVTIDGAGSKWRANGDIVLGATSTVDAAGVATGVVTVSNGGTLDATGQKIVLGQATGSEGTLNVRNFNSTALSKDITVGSSGTGTLLVENIGSLQNTGDAVLGEMPKGNGSADITGQFSTWETGNLTIGAAGTGNVTVELGGKLVVAGNLVLGRDVDSSGTLTLRDLSSRLGLIGGVDIVIGSLGNGTLNVERGFGFDRNASPLILGQFSSSTGTLNVRNANTIVEFREGMIGDAGTGVVLVEDNALLHNGGNVQLGIKVGGIGTGTVTGAGSEWRIDGNLVIGENGDGSKTSSVTISSGGLLTVNGQLLTIGQENGSSGILTIDGKDSKVVGTGAAKMEIGRFGSGTLQLTNGGSLTLNSVTLGAGDSGSGTVLVSGMSGGSPSTFSTLGALTIGGVANATGELSISGGGVVNSPGDVIIGRDASSTGTVLLSGQGSLWNFSDGTGNLTVGKAGTGSLNIGNNATLSVGTLTVADTSPNASVTVSTGATLSIGGPETVIGKSAGSVGTMSVTNGSTVTMKELFLGLDAGSSGSLMLTRAGGPATSVTVTNLTVGSFGHGDLEVRNGATLTDTGGILRVDGSNSSITIDGAGSALIADQANLSLGNQAAMTISNQGFLRTQGGFIRNSSIMRVDDANSQWQIGNFGLHVGATGKGFLFIDAGGAVVVNGPVVLGEADFGQILMKNGASLNVTGGNSIVIGGGALAQLSMFSGSQVSAAGAVIGQGSNLNLLEPGTQFTVNTLSVGRSPGDTGTLSVDNGHVSANLLSVNQGSAVSVTGGSIDLGTTFGQAPAGQVQVGLGGRLKDNGAVTGNVTTQLGGTVGGSGTINGKLINGGKVVPGDPQTLTVNGDYQQVNGGLLQIAIAGKTMPEFDHLNVTGHITLDMGANLELDFINGFAPKTGDKFDFLQSSDPLITGAFSNVTITGLAPGFQFVVAPDGVGTFGLIALNDGVATSVPEPSTVTLVLLSVLFAGLVTKRSIFSQLKE